MDVLGAALGAFFSPAFSAWGSPVSWAEVTGFVLALGMVWFNIRVNALAWPLAITSSAVYALLFRESGLYGEAALQLVFIAVAGWGWWEWLHGRQSDGSALRVRYLGARGRAVAIALTLAAWPTLALLLARHTDSAVPWLDAFPTVASLAGQWLLARQYVENWPAWVVVNIVSVGLFAWKALWLTMLLYALFAVLAAFGWRHWARRAASAQAA
ncbi:nicotinamide riboside transporter PnuC [Aquincola sp. MAHUQ-54]|uniref:Nicotinamide riboside transporter PnuC n=1 Tax=Aquincola agrisoli TaxID=3119538 RepID=A0AAW9QAV3_9BURK